MSHVDPVSAIHGSKSPLKTGLWTATGNLLAHNAWAVKHAVDAGQDPQKAVTQTSVAQPSQMDTKWLWIAGAAVAAWYFLAP